MVEISPCVSPGSHLTINYKLCCEVVIIANNIGLSSLLLEVESGDQLDCKYSKHPGTVRGTNCSSLSDHEPFIVL